MFNLRENRDDVLTQTKVQKILAEQFTEKRYKSRHTLGSSKKKKKE